MKEPGEPRLKAVIHVLRYLKKDPTLGIFLSNDPIYAISAYYDSKIQDELVTLYHISTSAQLAVISTKALIGVKHCDLLGKLAVSPSPPT